MKVFNEELMYGDWKDVELSGDYLKGYARAVEGGRPTPNAELILMTDGSAKKTKYRLFYAGNASTTEYVFFEIGKYIHNDKFLVDVIPFTYFQDEMTRTGVILIKKHEEEKLDKGV